MDDKDFLPLYGTDFIEFYVSNSLQAAKYYQSAFGFQPLAFSGLSTGNKKVQSYVVQQGKIRLVFSSPLVSSSEIGKHIDKHGDGVKNIALNVDNAESALKETVSRGAEIAHDFESIKDNSGTINMSGIKTYGDTVHLFIDRSKYKGVFLPGFVAWDTPYKPMELGLKYVDHMVGNVGWNDMNNWAEFYAKVMGFTQLISFDDKDISTDYTALMSKVMSNNNGRIKFPINEPAEGLNKSQIEEYLDFYNGPGVQHLALATDDIITTVSEMKSRGIEFLYVPETYYDNLIERVGQIEEDVELLRKNGILIDRDDDGYLLQIFTKPLVDRPTIFFEIIQRRGANSFGKGNFKALFLAIEREQRNRGTL